MSRNPPLAGRPPFATDEPDSVYYDSNQSAARRVRQPPPPNPNDRTSAYDLYDDYMDDTDEPPQGQDKNARLAAATNQQIQHQQRLAQPQSQRSPQPRPQQQQQPPQQQSHLMPQSRSPPQQLRSPQPPNQQLRSPQPSPHQQLRSPQPPPQPQRSPQPQQYQQQQQQQQPMYQPQPRQAQQPMPSPQPRQQQIPLAAPQPGYAAPIATLNLSRPPPIHTSQPQQLNAPFRNDYLPPSPASSSLYPPSSPSIASPHPLQAPSTPITPIFVASPRSSEKVKFANESPIIRGNSEETLIPKRGQKGDEFWRRFSMIAKEDMAKPDAQKESTWLRKTQSGTSAFSKWVWVIGIFILLCIGGGIGVGWYATHNESGHMRPGTIDGAANQTGANSTVIPTSTTHGPPPTSIRPTKVTPTNTVARRSVGQLPSGSVARRHHHHVNHVL